MKGLLIGTSNGKSAHSWPQLHRLQQLLVGEGLFTEVKIDSTVFKQKNPEVTQSGKERASAINVNIKMYVFDNQMMYSYSRITSFSR